MIILAAKHLPLVLGTCLEDAARNVVWEGTLTSFDVRVLVLACELALELVEAADLVPEAAG